MPLFQVRMRDATGKVQVRHEEAADEGQARLLAREHFGHGEVTSVKEVTAKPKAAKPKAAKPKAAKPKAAKPKAEPKQEAKPEPKPAPFTPSGQGPNGRAE